MKRKSPLEDDSFQENLDKIKMLENELASLKANYLKRSNSSDNEVAPKKDSTQNGLKKKFKKPKDVKPEHQKKFTLPI